MSALDQPWLHDLVTVLSAPTVMLSEPSGQVRDGGGAEGVLHADVRVLSLAVLTVGGTEPAPIGSGLDGARSAWFVAVPRALRPKGPRTNCFAGSSSAAHTSSST